MCVVDACRRSEAVMSGQSSPLLEPMPPPAPPAEEVVVVDPSHDDGGVHTAMTVEVTPASEHRAGVTRVVDTPDSKSSDSEATLSPASTAPIFSPSIAPPASVCGLLSPLHAAGGGDVDEGSATPPLSPSDLHITALGTPKGSSLFSINRLEFDWRQVREQDHGSGNRLLEQFRHIHSRPSVVRKGRRAARCVHVLVLMLVCVSPSPIFTPVFLAHVCTLTSSHTTQAAPGSPAILRAR